MTKKEAGGIVPPVSYETVLSLASLFGSDLAARFHCRDSCVGLAVDLADCAAGLAGFSAVLGPAGSYSDRPWKTCCLNSPLEN